MVITTDEHVFPFEETVEQSIQRISQLADAVAVVDVGSVTGIFDASTDSARTRARGVVVDAVRISDREPLSSPDGGIEFEFEGGEVTIGSETVRRGKAFPLLKPGERYLIMFQLHPAGGRWYPFLPFRVDTAGRLVGVEFAGSGVIDYRSPLTSHPLDDVVSRLRRR